jgi:hypothetical protein
MTLANGNPVSPNGQHHAAPGDRLPPQDAEAELALLGGLVNGAPRWMPYVRSVVEPGDFYRDSHQILYREICRLYDETGDCDPVLLAIRLREAGQWDRIGADRILAAASERASAAFVDRYAATVRARAKEREAIAAAHEILRRGYEGRMDAPRLLADLAGRLSARDRPAAAQAAIPLEDVASLEDVRRDVGEEDWLWNGWLVAGHMTVLASQPGYGKTRLAMDLCRRMWGALEWPDGTLASRPRETRSLWVASDRHHGQLCQVAREMGLPPDAVRLNATRRDPCGGLKLDDPGDVELLARRVEAVRPGLLVLDTVNKATRRLLYRTEEAEEFFGPILDIARSRRVAVLALTHLSKSGDPLDRRIEGYCRVLWRLDRPDPGQPARRKLSVDKSIDLYPAPLGITMGTEGNTYDLAPPCPPDVQRAAAAPAAAPVGRPATALAAASAWLRRHLADGPALCRTTIDAAEQAGHSRKTLFRAADAIGAFREGAPPNQYFRLPGPDEANRAEEEDGDIEPMELDDPGD